MAPSSFPTGETAAQIHTDRLWLYGFAVGGIAYGIHACTFFSCAHFLLKRERTAMTGVLLAYISVLFVAGSLMFGALTKLTDLSFVDNRAYPGGPVQWYNEVGGFDTWTILEDIAYFVAEILSDGLLLYRAWMIWDQNYYIVVFPFLVYVGIIGCGFPLMSIPTSWNNLRLVEAWFGCAAALNIAVTCLIVARLIMLSYKARSALGRDHSRRYASVAAIVVESAAPCAAFSVLYIVTYGGGSSVSFISWPLLSQVMCIAPQMILLRVALGQAFVRGGLPSSGRYTNTTTSASSGSGSGRRPRARWAPTPAVHFVIGQGASVQVDVDVREDEVSMDGDGHSEAPTQGGGGGGIILQAMRFAPPLEKKDGDGDEQGLSPESPYDSDAKKGEVV